MRLLQPIVVVCRVAMTSYALCALAGTARAVETTDVVLRPDIEFASQAAMFEPISGNYTTDEELTPPLRPPMPPTRPITPPQSPPTPPSYGTLEDYPTERYEYDSETYSPAPILDPSDCNSSGVFTGDTYGARAKQIPDNWLWGCNGSAYRTGPGNCDDWNVGCRWETSVDGMMLFREDANLAALRTQMIDNGALESDPIVYDQFDYSAGGRVSFIGRYPRCAGYEVQAAYEGINEWNASIVQEKVPLAGASFPPDSIEQSSLFYRSSLQSAELNVLRRCDVANRWFGGVRYIRFVDEINSYVDQEAPVPAMPAGGETLTDSYMLNEFNNNLIGFQIGGRHDLWQPMRRFTLEGFFNAGVYYNYIKRTDQMSVNTTTFNADNTTTFAEVTNNVVSEPSNVAYVCEASLTGVCRLNKCWACRAGYQVLWIDGVALAEDAFLDTGVGTRSLTFQGWHFGVECRR